MSDLAYTDAVQILALKKIADDVRFGHDLASRDSQRTLPPEARQAVKARVAEIEEQLRPTSDRYEAAFDVVVHHVGAAS